MPETADIDNIVLIIIDQLRADYVKYMKKCAELLPYHAICDTGSIPASTEAMHANISTGKYPKEHGFISKTARRRGDGLVQTLEKMRTDEISSLASLAKLNRFKAYIIGGKPETVSVMGLPEEVALGVYKEKEGFAVYGRELESIMSIEDFLGKIPQDRKPEQIDSTILELLTEIYSKKGNNKSLFIATLPALDYIGHDSGPNSSEIGQHLTFLDTEIHNLVRQSGNNTVWIVTGDHGCRKTTEFLIEANMDNPRKVAVYQQKEELFEFCEEHFLDVENHLADIQYDGGILRIWFKEGIRMLSEEDVKFFSRYGEICGADYEQRVNKNLRQLYENSKHPNLGDITIFAKVDVTFCKGVWIAERAFNKKIPSKERLNKNELPLGEHGSHHYEDRFVPFMSNYEFNIDLLINTGIRDLVNYLMRAKS